MSQSLSTPSESPAARPRQSSWRGIILRTTIPTACVVSVTMLSQHLGTIGAGLLGTFPCMLTSMLVVTSLEDGLPVAGRLAQAFPVGQLATLSFVITFGQLCPFLGVTIALVAGYVASVVTLASIEWFNGISRAHTIKCHQGCKNVINTR